MTTVIDTPEGIARYRRLIIYHAVKLDHDTNGKLLASRSYRLSAIKKEFGLKGDRHEVFAALQQLLIKDGTLTACPNHPDRVSASRSNTNLCGECFLHPIQIVQPAAPHKE